MDLAKGFAVNQIAFGLGMLAAPAVFGRGWVGDRAGDAWAQVLIRSIGARNVALGAGTLLARSEGGDGRRHRRGRREGRDRTNLKGTVPFRFATSAGS